MLTADMQASPRVLLPRVLQPTPPVLGRQLMALHGNTMGSTWSVKLLGAPESLLPAEVQAVLDAVVAEFSPWERSSMPSRFRTLPPGAALPLTAASQQVLRCALAVAQASGGAFDPTAAPLVEAWGFGPGLRHDDPAFAAPTRARLEALALGHHRLALDAGGALRQTGGLALDLCAVAKGWAVDHLSQWLSARGLHDHLVEVGGELRGSGQREQGQPWWVAIEAPAAQVRTRPTHIALHGLSVATSGDYRRRWRDGDRWRPHTIDPRTREPVAHGLASVTVVHDSAMWADAWSTAIMVLGPDEGLALAERQQVAALLRWPDAQGRWHEATSPALQALEA